MKRTLLATLLLLLPACGTGEIDCGAPADASGTWSYTGDQVNPTASLTGTVVLERTGTCTMQGSVSLTIDDGSPAVANGAVSALFNNENSIDITLHADGERLQMGVWHGDTISGEWIENSGGGSTGAFQLVRTGGV